MVERVRITPTNMTLKNASGGIAFSTDYKYIRTDPNGNMRLTPVAATPINYAFGSYNPFDTSQTNIFVESNSGISILLVQGDPNTSMDVSAPYAFPSDGNLAVGPYPTVMYAIGNPNGPRVINQTPAGQPIYATAYADSRYIGTIRMVSGVFININNGGPQGNFWGVAMRVSDSEYGAAGVVRSVPVYKGEKLRLVRSGGLGLPATFRYGSPLMLGFNSGTSTIGLRVTA